MKTLGDIGELAAVARLAALLPTRADVVVGPGDDCAVVRSPGDARFDLLLTSDPVIEGVHFDEGTPTHRVGYKAVGRVLSDIAAMGGEPLWALLDLGAPAESPVARLEEIYHGAVSLAQRHNLALVGGDTGAAERLALHVFAVGRAPAGTAITRSGASPGDALYVTGSLGGSALGKHLAFEPRVREGLWLREQGFAAAMIDLSDGLGSDLRRLCAMSGTGASIRAAAVPVDPAALRIDDARGGLAHALEDGEDFELLFCVGARAQKRFEKAWREEQSLACVQIGIMTERQGLVEIEDGNGQRRTLAETGYEHFNSSSSSP